MPIQILRDDLVSNYNFPHIKTVVINNPIDIELVKERSLESVDYPFPKEYINLISVGNFRGEKRFDLLIESFSPLDDRYRFDSHRRWGRRWIWLED